MDVLWDSPGEVRARDVTDRLGGYALTTISTILDRLSHRGIVLRHKDGHVVWFSAFESRAEYTAALMREALATSSEPERAIEQFVRDASGKELRAIRRVIATESDRTP